MSEILFRGKRKDNEQWVYGFYWNRGEFAHYIKVIDKNGNLEGDYEIEFETLGEYTQCTDKKKKKIFTGDIIKTRRYETITTNKKIVVDFDYEGFPIYGYESKSHCNNNYLALVVGGWGGYSMTGTSTFLFGICNEIVGNKFDNPELLEEMKKQKLC